MWRLVQKYNCFVKPYNLLKNEPILLLNYFFSHKIKNAVYWCFVPVFSYHYCEAHNLDRGHIDCHLGGTQHGYNEVGGAGEGPRGGA
jgi:hypothetical protein